MVNEEKDEAAEVEAVAVAVLTPPLSLEGSFAAENRTGNLVQRIFTLFRNVRPGSDLTHFQLPPLFNMPKSQLQCYGEGVYCIGENYLSKCAKGKSSLERFISVVAWSISTTRPAIFGLAPFNPILGETHHVSKGTLNVLLEQISHHPPVSALHATDQEENIELIWCHNPVPRFHGTSIEAVIKGKKQLNLLRLGETYEIDTPNLLMKLLPSPRADWAGNVRIICKDSGLKAELCYHKSNSFLGFGGNSRTVKGKIFQYESSSIPIYEINGFWDSTVSLKDVNSGKVSVLYDAKKAISILKAPTLKDPKGLMPTESAVVWGEVSQGILNKEWDKAWQAKRSIEERERKLQRERKSKGEIWTPKHFTLTHVKEGEWECWPLEKLVCPAPITVTMIERAQGIP